MGETRFTREELYELVWSEPITDIAARLGISDRGLAKVCARANVPVPGRGYWQKCEAGLPVSKLKLPPAGEGVRPWVSITTVSEQQRLIYDRALNVGDTEADIQRECTPARTVVVPAAGPLHAIAREIQCRLKGQKPDDYGMVSFAGDGLPSVRVSPGNVGRAIAIVDAFLKGIDARGWSVHRGKRFEFGIGATMLAFSIYERSKRSDHVDTPAETKARQLHKQGKGSPFDVWRIPKFDYAPSGQLSLTIDGAWRSGVPYTFRDTEKTTLESRLNEVMIAIRKMAAILAEQERQEQERLERQRAAEALAVRQREERAAEEGRRKALLREAEASHQALILRSYIRRLLRIAEAGAGVGRCEFKSSERRLSPRDPHEGVRGGPCDPATHTNYP